METIILNAVSAEIEGIVECTKKDNLLMVQYSLISKERPRVMRLKALSSKKPCNTPVKIDVPVFERGRAWGKKEISLSELAMSGYVPRDIDTFVLTFEDKSQTRIAATGFGGLRWDISYQIDRICDQKEKNPVYSGGKLLEKLKAEKDSAKDKSEIIRALSHAGKSLEKVKENPLNGYNWYRFDKRVYPLGLSIFTHITENMDNCREGAILIGIKGDGHTAVAVKGNKDNPFATALDCSVHINGYWIVGVCFKEDGQYFERI